MPTGIVTVLSDKCVEATTVSCDRGLVTATPFLDRECTMVSSGQSVSIEANVCHPDGTHSIKYVCDMDSMVPIDEKGVLGGEPGQPVVHGMIVAAVLVVMVLE